MRTKNLSANNKKFSDLLIIDSVHGPILESNIHPISNLLSLSPDEILELFEKNQVQDFTKVFDSLKSDENIFYKLFSQLNNYSNKENKSNLNIPKPSSIFDMFIELHTHVMKHPVWLHPCFIRIFNGKFTQYQLSSFAINYFNQIKNTRQCVALTQGRLSSFISLPYGSYNEKISEITQIILAQLLADEYGVSTYTIDSYPNLAKILTSNTHIVMYRQIFEGLNIPFEKQDVPMLHSTADNILIQRLLAGHSDFTILESLASVGLGMEWGVPEFFSLLLGGIIRWAWKNNVELTQYHLIVFIAHVKYDIFHAISVMIATSLFSYENDSVHQIKQATNMLMSARYNMMSELYTHIFEEDCSGITEIKLDSCYHITDYRIKELLLKERKLINNNVVNVNLYKTNTEVPFVFNVKKH